MRTYSRRANAARTTDAVFEDNIFPSSKWKQEVALDDDEEESTLKRGKPTKTKEVRGDVLKKQKKKKTGQKKKEAPKKSDDDLASGVEYSFDNNPLFGEGLQPVKAAKTSRGKRPSTGKNSKPKSKSSRKYSSPPVSEHVTESTVKDEKSKPPAEHVTESTVQSQRVQSKPPAEHVTESTVQSRRVQSKPHAEHVTESTVQSRRFQSKPPAEHVTESTVQSQRVQSKPHAEHVTESTVQSRRVQSKPHAEHVTESTVQSRRVQSKPPDEQLRLNDKVRNWLARSGREISRHDDASREDDWLARSGREISRQDDASREDDWAAKSDPDTSEHGETSKEVWRAVQGNSGEDGRHKLFPKEFFLNLHAVPSEDDYEIINQDHLIKARKDAFLSKLAHASKKTYPVYNGDGDIEAYMSSSDTDDITETQTGSTENQTGYNNYMGTQTGTYYTETQTGSNYTGAQTGTYYTGTQTGSNYTGVQTGTNYTGAQTGTNYSRTLTGLSSTPLTASKSSDTLTATRLVSETSTYSNPKTASQFETHTEKQPGSGFDTVTKSGTDVSYKPQPVIKCSNKHRADIEAQSDLSDPGTHIKRKRINTKYADEKLKMMRTDLLQNKSWSPQMDTGKKLSPKGKRIQKYMSSTVRRSVSTGNIDFPSEMSSVTLADPSNLQQQEEKTPRKKTERFKIPRSPTKHMAVREQRKGNLEPKNSTRLFTTGFVEIVDVIPQMSTIKIEADTGTPQIEKSVPVFEENQLEVGNRQARQNIKTSTPNKVDAVDQDFQFEIDVSPVNMESDEEELHIHETREVNSEEILHLTYTVTEQETTFKPDTMSVLKKSPAKTVQIVKLTSNKMEEFAKRNNKEHVKENVKVLSKQQLNKTKASKNPAKRLKKNTKRKTLKTIPSATHSRKGKQTVYNRKSLRNKQYRKASRGNNSIKLTVEEYHSEVKKQSDKHESNFEPIVPDTDKTVDNVTKKEGPKISWDSTENPADSIADKEPDVYDIDNSVVNATSPWSRKIARQNNRLNIIMAVENGSLLKKELKFNETRKTNSLYNDLSLPAEINKKSSKFTVPQREKSTPKDFRDTNYDDLNTCSVINGIPVCTFGSKDCLLFGGGRTLMVYKHEDHRSHLEILNTVPIDDLLG